MLCDDPPPTVCLAAQGERLGSRTVSQVVHPAQQRAVGDACGCKENLVAADQALLAEDLVQKIRNTAKLAIGGVSF